MLPFGVILPLLCLVHSLTKIETAKSRVRVGKIEEILKKKKMLEHERDRGGGEGVMVE